MAGTGLDWLLNSFTERTPGVRHTVAVSGDGLLVAASRELSSDRAQQLAAVVAGVVSLAQGVSACVAKGPVLRTVVQMRQHLLFVVSLDAGEGLASLAALVTVGCDAGAVAYEMATLAEQAGRALTPGSR